MKQIIKQILIESECENGMKINTQRSKSTITEIVYRYDAFIKWYIIRQGLDDCGSKTNTNS